jgi:hypothetical protein
MFAGWEGMGDSDNAVKIDAVAAVMASISTSG